MRNYINYVACNVISLMDEGLRFNMENSYEIGVANRYALFLDENEDPLEVLKVKEQEQEAKRKTKRSEKKSKVKLETEGIAGQDISKEMKEIKDTKTLETRETSEENTTGKINPRLESQRCERKVRFVEQTREAKDFTGGGEFKSEFSKNSRYEEETHGRGRGGGFGFRGMGRGREFRAGGFNNRGKRELDRQSGSDKTGVKPVEKRFGAGARNWGTYKDDVEEQWNSPESPDEQPESIEKAENEIERSPENVDVKENDDSEDKNVDTVAEPRVLTLDEYYASRRAKQKPTYNIRKAGEGEDLTRWKNMYELKKKNGEEEEEEDEYEMVDYPQRAGRQKYLLDINFHFSDSRRGGRGFGRGSPRNADRGRGASGMAGDISSRGPGETRSPSESSGWKNRSWREPFQRDQRQATPKVDDENDFPSLS